MYQGATELCNQTTQDPPTRLHQHPKRPQLCRMVAGGFFGFISMHHYPAPVDLVGERNMPDASFLIGGSNDL